MFRIITSSLTDKEIRMAPTLGVPVIFLGGNCKDNAWRDEIIDHYGKELKFLDPFDTDYDPKEDTYKELAGMINSDYVIFYKGGEQSEQEKKFLDLIGRRDNLIKNFDKLEDLKKFLDNIKDANLECISSKIRKCAAALEKLSAPYMTFKGKHLDFHFEKLDLESIHKVIDDIFEGKTISLPVITGESISYIPFNIKDIDPSEKDAMLFLNLYRDKQKVDRMYSNKTGIPVFYYDDITHKYEMVEDPVLIPKTARHGVEYEYACTKIDLPKDLAEEIIAWGKKNILDKYLYTEGDNSKGREDDIHITLLYGIISDKPGQTAKVVGENKPLDIRLGLVNAFKDKENYDVIKIAVESGDLEKLHYTMRDKIKNDNTFPTYNPHVTIAYVKKNSMDKLIGDGAFKGKTFKANNVTFSDGKNKENSIKKLPLNI